MKKIWKLSLLAILLVTMKISVKAQNLVQNSSFEDSICQGSDIDCAVHWINPTSFSPDYFRSGGPLGYLVPSNNFGFQIARTGSAYAGVITAMFNANGREYIQSELLDSLKHGLKYCVSFYVCLVDSSPFAVNNIGAYFSDSAISSNLIINLPYQPQIDNDPFLNPLTFRNTWMAVADTFMAQGGERFITIGNFLDDASTDTSHDSINTPWPNYGYYYIDDVSVILCDSSVDISESVSNSDVTINQFQFINLLKIDSRNKKIISFKLYDCQGKVTYTKIVNAFSTEVNLNLLNSGVYFINVLLENAILTKKILIISKT